SRLPIPCLRNSPRRPETAWHRAAPTPVIEPGWLPLYVPIRLHSPLQLPLEFYFGDPKTVMRQPPAPAPPRRMKDQLAQPGPRRDRAQIGQAVLQRQPMTGIGGPDQQAALRRERVRVDGQHQHTGIALIDVAHMHR